MIVEAGTGQHTRWLGRQLSVSDPPIIRWSCRARKDSPGLWPIAPSAAALILQAGHARIFRHADEVRGHGFEYSRSRRQLRRQHLHRGRRVAPERQGSPVAFQAPKQFQPCANGRDAHLAQVLLAELVLRFKNNIQRGESLLDKTLRTKQP